MFLFLFFNFFERESAGAEGLGERILRSLNTGQEAPQGAQSQDLEITTEAKSRVLPLSNWATSECLFFFFFFKTVSQIVAPMTSHDGQTIFWSYTVQQSGH